MPLTHSRRPVKPLPCSFAPHFSFFLLPSSPPVCCCVLQGAIPAGVELCGEGMAESISASIDALLGGDASAAVFKADIGEIMVRPL